MRAVRARQRRRRHEEATRNPVAFWPKVGDTVYLRPDATAVTFFDRGVPLEVRAIIKETGVLALKGVSSFYPDPIVQYATVYDVTTHPIEKENTP